MNTYTNIDMIGFAYWCSERPHLVSKDNMDNLLKQYIKKYPNGLTGFHSDNPVNLDEYYTSLEEKGNPHNNSDLPF
jgi:hypothetical protein